MVNVHVSVGPGHLCIRFRVSFCILLMFFDVYGVSKSLLNSWCTKPLGGLKIIT